MGAICEITTMENRLLFVGTIQAWHPLTNELCAELRRGESTPRGVICHTEVKIRVYADGGTGNMKLLYGVVTRNALDRWWIEIRGGSSRAERRESFRLRIKAEAEVVREADGSRSPCTMVDISLGGLGFLSRESFEDGEMLQVSGLQLVPEGPVYELGCQVRRSVEQPDMPRRVLYGCSFQALSRRQEQQLSRDIFALQAMAISRRSSGRT